MPLTFSQANDLNTEQPNNIEATSMEFFFRCCAYVLLVAVLDMILLNVMAAVLGTGGALHLPRAVLVPALLLALPGPFAFFALWPAMMWHCLFISKMSMAAKIIWLLTLLFTIFLGVLIYYFVRIEAER